MFRNFVNVLFDLPFIRESQNYDFHKNIQQQISILESFLKHVILNTVIAAENSYLLNCSKMQITLKNIQKQVNYCNISQYLFSFISKQINVALVSKKHILKALHLTKPKLLNGSCLVL